MSEPLVSIIIPIFNCEKYLHKCLSSVSNQTYSNIEVILINDGSTDSSKEICESFVKKDSRFILINQENKGVSYSRNIGIKKSRGKFIQFTDSDDWLEEDMIEKMVLSSQKNNSDIVFSEYYNFYQNNNCLKHVKIKDYDYNFKELISNENTLYGGFPWNKLIKKESITNLYNEEIHYYENLLFFLENSKNISSYSVVHEPLYTYNINNQSAVHSKKYNIKKISVLDAFELIIDIVDYKYRDFYMYMFISKYNENLLKIKKNNLNISLINKYSSLEKKYYSDIKYNKIPFKCRIKLFIIKYLPFIYKLIKNK